MERQRPLAAAAGDRDRPRAAFLARGRVPSALSREARARQLPHLTTPALAAPAAAGVRRLLLAAAAESSLIDVAKGANAVELLIGPEGGLEERERAAARNAGYRAGRLGPRILRSETAALAALAVLQSSGGDLG